VIKLFEIQAKASVDAGFREQLLADPRAALAAEGVELPGSMDVEVRSSGANTLVLTLPPVVDRTELSDGELAGTAAGFHIPLVNMAAQANLWAKVIAPVLVGGGTVGVAYGTAAALNAVDPARS
jgi:hypothetical protein